jgi:tetratricopeptide (TPR) repeat protein
VGHRRRKPVAARWVVGAALIAAAFLPLPAGEPGPPRTEEGAAAPRGPLPPPGFLDACLELIEQGRFAEARGLLEPVVRDHPGWARAHFFLGLTYHEERRYEAAEELFRRALELDPQYPTPLVFHGWSLYYLGRIEQSRAAFEAYLKVQPGYPDAIFALGLIDFDADAVDAAEVRFRETVRLAAERQDRPTEAKARARLADVHLRNGDLEEARKELERSVALNPDNYEPYFKLSRVLQRLGDAEGAERARRKHDELREKRHPPARVQEPGDS